MDKVGLNHKSKIKKHDEDGILSVNFKNRNNRSCRAESSFDHNKKPELRIEAILEKELYSTPPLMPVVVAKLVGTNKDIPRVFQATKDFSTVDLKHLRRIRDLPGGEIECVLCKIESATTGITHVEDKFAQEHLFKDFRIAHVPSKAPKTVHQLEACSKIWPCKYAKSNYLIQCIEGSIFNDSEMLVIKTIASSVINYIRVNNYKVGSGSVVFRYSKIYGVGLTAPQSINENPTKHSTMSAIDSVAIGAGGGHWSDRSSGTDIDSSNLFRTIQSKLDNQEELKNHVMEAHFIPYLCTNYDVFVTEEPCIMCTMGLIQSRIRRLFYLSKESVTKLINYQTVCFTDGAIEKLLLHRERNLNHRFEAWKITLLTDD